MKGLDALMKPAAPAYGLRVLVVLVLVFALSSCGDGPGGRGDFALERVYGEGTAVQFTVRLSRLQLTTAEELLLELETRADEQWRVAFPEVAEEIGGFAVVGREPEDRNLRPDGTLISTRTYRLEPFLEGTYTIPGLELGFGEPGTEFNFTLVSDEFDVEVESELPPTVGEQDIEEIEGPQELEDSTWQWVAGGSAGGVLLAVAAVLLVARVRRRRRDAAAGAYVAPWTEAQAALDDLVAGDAAADMDALYTGLTRIIRHYIERRFDIRAPELTTEEFLTEAKRSEQLAPYRESLESFLTHADLVKFAGYTPQTEEVTASVDACRDFVAETTPEGAT